jgi:hypothetical protein
MYLQHWKKGHLEVLEKERSFGRASSPQMQEHLLIQKELVKERDPPLVLEHLLIPGPVRQEPDWLQGG